MPAPPTRAPATAMLPLQLGALVIPLAGTGVVTLIPRLAEVHGISLAQVALAITIYTLPFATAQLFAGTIVERFSARVAVATGAGLFAAGSLGCALAPDFTVFLGSRFLQGVGAALLLPVFMAMVAEIVPAARLGRSYGVFQSTQMLGMTAGPLVAGMLEVWLGWRWFFAFLALLATIAGAWFLAVFRRSPAPRARRERPLRATLDAMRDASLLRLSLAGAALFFAAVGTNTYLAVALKRGHGLGEDAIGAVLAVQGAIGIPVSPLAGAAGDAFGRKRLGVLALVTYGIGLIALGSAVSHLVPAVALVAVLGAAGAASWGSLGTLVIEGSPGSRHTATSVYNAFRFFGYALAPPVLAGVHARAGFVGVCLVNAVLLGVAAAWLGTMRRPASPR